MAPFALGAATLGFANDAVASEPRAYPPYGKVEWRKEWPKFSALEGIATLGATVGGFVLERRISEPAEARIKFEVPVVDTTSRFLFRGRSKHVQDTFNTYSDIGFRMMAFFPYVVDAGVALGVHWNPEVAAQMALIDLQALTFSGVSQIVLSNVLGRARPYAQDCDDKGLTFSRTCGGANDNRSFYSGHTAAAFTSAGLVCVHHQNMPLFGGGPVEAWACTWAMAVAATTGLFRMISDAHYASDVIVGAGVGWFYGYVMPRYLHYSAGPVAQAMRTTLKWTPAFTPSGDGGVLTFGGTL